MSAIPQLWQFVALLAIHWVADFVVQTHWQASNKSKQWDALLRHVTTYTLVLGAGAFLLFDNLWVPLGFTLCNGVLHLGTDYFTSRWSSRLYAKQDWHNFFVVIGLDQLIHQITLAATFAWFASNARCG